MLCYKFYFFNIFLRKLYFHFGITQQSVLGSGTQITLYKRICNVFYIFCFCLYDSLNHHRWCPLCTVIAREKAVNITASSICLLVEDVYAQCQRYAMAYPLCRVAFRKLLMLFHPHQPSRRMDQTTGYIQCFYLWQVAVFLKEAFIFSSSQKVLVYNLKFSNSACMYFFVHFKTKVLQHSDTLIYSTCGTITCAIHVYTLYFLQLRSVLYLYIQYVRYSKGDLNKLDLKDVFVTCSTLLLFPL